MFPTYTDDTSFVPFSFPLSISLNSRTHTFFPGPHPLRTKGEYVVRPPQSMEAACSLS